MGTCLSPPPTPGSSAEAQDNQPCPILLTTWVSNKLPPRPQGEARGWALGKGAVTDPGSVLE